MDKDNILKAVSIEEIYCNYLGLKKYPQSNISSPFSEDKNASFKLYKNGTFKCHSSGKQGDVFQFVADLNNLDCKSEFAKVTGLIAEKFSINENPIIKHFEYKTKALEKIHFNYWSQGNWNVSKDALEQYKVFALDKFEYYNSKKKEITKIKLFTGVLGFAYCVGQSAELYIPKQEKTKKFFLNKLTRNDIFGFDQLPPQCENIIICAGKKDALILNANGLNAVSFRSENHYITKDQFKSLKSKCERLFICYDNDDAGKKSMTKYADVFGMIPINLPKEFNDIADYFKVFKIDDFKAILNEILKSQKEQNEFKGEQTIFHITEDYLSKFYKFRNNKIALEIECCPKGSSDWKPLNENSLFIELQKRGIKISINNLLAILKSGFVQDYNPLAQYFNDLPKWDGKTDWIGKLCSYVNVKDKEQFIYHFRKWCVRTVKCVLNEEYFNKQAFVLVHKGQSSGKSTFCRYLCPPTLSKYIAEDISNDKDARILLCKNFLINLDELAVLSRKEINSLKSYFSKTVVNERLPYDRKNSILPRVCSFIGSTNMSSFLNDETGSVRWLCFELTGQINFAYKDEVNINNLWSQALSLAFSNFDCELSPEDIKQNDLRNKQFSLLSQEQEIVSKYFEHPTAQNGEFFTATDVLLYLQPLGIRLNKVQLGKALSSNFEKIKDSKRQVYGYLLKSKPLFESPFKTKVVANPNALPNEQAYK